MHKLEADEQDMEGDIKKRIEKDEQNPKKNYPDLWKKRQELRGDE